MQFKLNDELYLVNLINDRLYVEAMEYIDKRCSNSCHTQLTKGILLMMAPFGEFEESFDVLTENLKNHDDIYSCIWCFYIINNDFLGELEHEYHLEFMKCSLNFWLTSYLLSEYFYKKSKLDSAIFYLENSLNKIYFPNNILLAIKMNYFKILEKRILINTYKKLVNISYDVPKFKTLDDFNLFHVESLVTGGLLNYEVYNYKKKYLI